MLKITFESISLVIGMAVPLIPFHLYVKSLPNRSQPLSSLGTAMLPFYFLIFSSISEIKGHAFKKVADPWTKLKGCETL